MHISFLLLLQDTTGLSSIVKPNGLAPAREALKLVSFTTQLAGVI